MLGLSHVLLHVGLCSAIGRLPPDTTIAMRVHVTYPVRPPQPDTQFDKVFRFTRGDDPSTEIEFDIPRGIYHLQMDVPKYKCSGGGYFQFLSDHNREIAESLHDIGTPPPPEPDVLLQGTAPTSFLYVKPTFVLFDKSVVCKGPVDTPLPSHIAVENDQDGYYVRLYSDPKLDAHGSLVVALRLRTPTGLYHYVRVPIDFPTHHGGWPESVGFNVTEDQLDGLATEKTDTLLCPKLWETSVHGV